MMNFCTFHFYTCMLHDPTNLAYTFYNNSPRELSLHRLVKYPSSIRPKPFYVHFMRPSYEGICVVYLVLPLYVRLKLCLRYKLLNYLTVKNDAIGFPFIRPRVHCRSKGKVAICSYIFQLLFELLIADDILRV